MWYTKKEIDKFWKQETRIFGLVILFGILALVWNPFLWVAVVLFFVLLVLITFR